MSRCGGQVDRHVANFRQGFDRISQRNYRWLSVGAHLHLKVGHPGHKSHTLFLQIFAVTIDLLGGNRHLDGVARGTVAHGQRGSVGLTLGVIDAGPPRNQLLIVVVEVHLHFGDDRNDHWNLQVWCVARLRQQTKVTPRCWWQVVHLMLVPFSLRWRIWDLRHVHLWWFEALPELLLSGLEPQALLVIEVCLGLEFDQPAMQLALGAVYWRTQLSKSSPQVIDWSTWAQHPLSWRRHWNNNVGRLAHLL